MHLYPLVTDDGDVWSGWGSVILVCLVVTLVFGLIIVATYQSLKSVQTKTTAKAVLARDEAYRELAEQATSAIKRSANEQERMAADLAELRNRIAAIETMLREVG
jgi:hypothetical protein